MKSYVKLLALILALLMIGLTACTGTGDPQNTEQPSGTSVETNPDTIIDETETQASTEQPGTDDLLVYNIIFALATVPPVLASLDAIQNGNETYAIIERGKTYNGIDSLEYFHNAGFDPANNTSNGFTATEWDAMINKIKELNVEDKDVFFNIYVQDGTALMGAGLAANAGLTTDEFHVVIVEDGTGAYNALYTSYVKDKSVTAEADGIYDAYAAAVESAQTEFEAVMGKTDNKHNDAPFKYNIGKAYALAALPNFTYWIQDKAMLTDIFTSAKVTDTQLMDALGLREDNAKTELKASLKFEKISQAIDKLTETQRTDYLTLMYGSYYEATFNGLTRTERAGEPAPAKKLVYIGARHKGYPHLATDAAHGIGGLSADATVPTTYAELDAKYKTPLLFATEADYALFLDVLNNSENYREGTDDLKRQAQVACFNYYIDYIYTLKLTYALYGQEYDIIMKGHPREAVGGSSEWGNIYSVIYQEDGSEEKKYYVYDQLLDAALLAFHEKDSTGKYFGMVPYGTSAENLAYLGVEIAICGLPSSTYNGYDTDVDVVFIMAETNEDIAGSGVETPASQVKARYEAGNLTYTNKDGKEVTTEFYNLGNTYKALSLIYTQKGDIAMAEKYLDLFTAWMLSVHPGATGIDGQGFPLKAEA
ncbi:MAG: hypothetical protein E7645_01340 [Ruminococcaceae bacterium]|nr:hypothetical protein [Oscillospiraceae bacterium]